MAVGGPTFGQTTIDWDTGDGSNGRVHLIEGQSGERLFATGSRGRKVAAWVRVGRRYEFVLYSGGESRRRLASLVVNRRDDLSIVFPSVVAVLILLAALAPLSRQWFLELAPAAVTVAVLWLKLMHVTETLRPGDAPNPRAAVSATLVFILFAAGALMMLERRRRLLLSILLNLTWTTIAVADLVHDRFYGDVISMAELTHAGQVLSVLPSILALIHPTDAWYFADVAIGLSLLTYYRRACARTPAILWRQRGIVTASCLAASAFLLPPVVGMIQRQQERLLQYRWTQRGIITRMGIVTFHSYDLLTHVRYRVVGRLRVSEQDRQEVYQFLMTRRRKTTERSALVGVARRRNLILLSAESIARFPIGLQIGGQAVTPNLSAFAGESLFFTNFYDQTHFGLTSDGEFTTLQSLHPAAVGAVSTRYSDNGFRALPSVLAEHGYATWSSVGARSDVWNLRWLHQQFGIARSDFEDSYSGERFNTGVADRDFFDQTIPRLRALPRPFMAHLLSMSSHHPYTVPKVHQTLKLGALERTQLGDYLQAVHYFDAAFGGWIDGLRTSGLLDTTVIAVYGDHHPQFDDLHSVARLASMPENNDRQLWELRHRLPLMIRLPRGESAGPRSVAAGHLDTAPTLLSLLGIDDPRSVMFGRDLTTDADSLVVFRDGGFADGRHYYIGSTDPDQPDVCYDVATGNRLDCGMLAQPHRQALEQLRMSDLIIEGDLIPDLAGRVATAIPAAGTK